MKKNKVLAIITSILVIGNISFGQDTLTHEKFIWYVKKFHPIALQAKLLELKGESTIQKSRGGFDPYLYTSFDSKTFDNKEYFTLLNSGLKIPTWYGIEVKTSFNRATGGYINPENHVPQSGLLLGGVSAPLGNGLFIDKRRAQLKQAKIYNESTEWEKKQILNDLFYFATNEYWRWVQTYNQLKIYDNSVTLAKERFEAVKQNNILGDSPAIDTLEAYIQYQSRLLSKYQLEMEYLNQTQELSNYLWYEDNTPLEITEMIVPPTISNAYLPKKIVTDTIIKLQALLKENNPSINLYNYKLKELEIDKKLKTEMLKPKLNLNYNFLNEGLNNNIINQFSTLNYKWGFEFSFPIFIREQRGDLSLTKLKIQDTQYSQIEKELQIKNKAQQQINTQDILANQITLFNSATNNYFELLQAEKQKFLLGESSLFLINSREIYYIEAQNKLIDLICKFETTKSSIFWAFGVLNY